MEILHSYGRVIRRLILIPPHWIERKLNGEVEARKAPPINTFCSTKES